ncbi:hypothetical protein [Streptomyces inhibens]|uniref:hypothetical protein n=1 Tax=Streptomyces inhibens TaxID=2293571 RepID=UPI001EE71F71|nr:hypothetical protein [Streptomyces inhibens]UKY48519.1 hypothetical protein KI385_06715 [Streptomyces inhibens]
MTDTDPDLIVPVQLHALVVNETVKEGNAFMRWQPNFAKMLANKTAAEPAPSKDTEGIATGVHVQWQLPEALTSGHYDPDTGETTFPLVPNRWLVVRHHTVPSPRPGAGQTRAAAWMIHSDYLEFTNGVPGKRGASPFLSENPEDGELREDWIGRAHDLREGGWSEPAPVEPFLTAIGPGLPAFAGFQPYHQNVFSFHDTLLDLKGDGHNVPAPTTLSYFVIGWYSDDTAEFLRRAADIPGLLPPETPSDDNPGVFPPLHRTDDLLRALRWALPGYTDLPEDQDPPVGDGPRRSVYTGTALGIPWTYYNWAPPSAMPGHNDLPVAVGHSTADALGDIAALQSRSARTGELIKALYHGTIDGLDQADGGHDLDEVTRRAWFSASASGYSWQIVPRPTDSPEPARAAPTNTPSWLAELNEHQRRHDAAGRELAHVQERLRTLWWLKGLPGEHPDGFDEAAAWQLEPDNEGTPAERAAALIAELTDLRQHIPQGTTSEQVQEAIDRFAADHHLPADLELRRVAEPPFHRTSDPVVLITGAGAKEPLTRHPDDPLPCRTVSGLLTALRVNGQWDDTSVAPPPLDRPEPGPIDVPNLPAPGPALLAEFALLDRAARTRATGDPEQRSALEVALEKPDEHVQGVLAEYTSVWSQPWLPMYLQWDLRYHPIPYQAEDGTRNWSFDGSDYSWEGTGADPGNGEDGPEWIPFTARTFLTPSAPYVLARQIDRLNDTHGTTAAERAGLRTLRDAYAELDVLSQTLDGFNDALLMRDIGARAATPEAVARLTGEAGHVASPGVPGDDVDFRFQPVRAGQFYFRDLRIIDRFGRSVVIATPEGDAHLQLQLRPVVSTTPSAPLEEGIEAPKRFAQLPPRLLQDARVRMRTVSGRDDAEVRAGRAGRAGDSDSPLVGWVLINNLDDNLLVYGPGGEAFGELRIIRTAQSTRETAWTPLPSSPYHDETDESFGREHPHLAGFVRGLVGPTGPYTALLATIDQGVESMTDTAAQDDRAPARLVGRPVALYRVRLDLELRGDPLSNPGWDHALGQSAEEYPDYRWPIRLGNPGQLTDGLLGYYTSAEGPGGKTDYSRLHVVEPAIEDPYLVDIDNGAGLELPARPADGDPVSHHLTILADPHNPIHATTDILPVTDLELPADLVHNALLRIRAAFRLNPLLAPTRIPVTAPARRNGGRPGTFGDGQPLPDEMLVMIRPAAWHGTWTWAEPLSAADGDWQERAILAADTDPHTDDPVPHARAGYLLLQPAQDATEEELA